MPKNKFNGFYYGIGMKLDEASVEKAGQQLESKLNKVVDNVVKDVAAISQAVSAGVSDVDTHKLVQSLAAARNELGHLQDFDPSKLQEQIDGLQSSFETLGTKLGDIKTELTTLTDDLAARLSNVEIKTSKQGKDALKADLKGIIELARGYRDVMEAGGEIDTSALSQYFLKVKRGFKSLQDSGNPLEMFADKELARYFVTLTNIFRDMGAPIQNLREELFSMSSVFKKSFQESGATGATNIFKDLGYQIESVNIKLSRAEAKLQEYESKIAGAKSRINSTGFAVSVDDDKNLNFDQKIAKIQEYEDIASGLDYGEEWATVTRNQIALIQAAEKELKAALKTPEGQTLLHKWEEAFGKFDFKNETINRESSRVLSYYIEAAQEDLTRLQKLHSETIEEIATHKATLGRLEAREAATKTPKKTTKTTRTTHKENVDGVVANVEAKIKINEDEWRRVINNAIANVEPKIKPFKIKVEATQGKILEQVKKIRDASLVNKGKDGVSDVNAFNKRFVTFQKGLESCRKSLITYLQTEWHPALKDAFSFKMELLGIDNKSLTAKIDTHMLATVDAINDALASKPIEFHSNIDQLLAEIEEKVKNLKLDGNIGLNAGNLTLNPQGLGNVNLILNGLTQAAAPTGGSAQIAAPQRQPSVSPPPATPTTDTSEAKSVNIQAIYDSIGELDRTTLTLETVRAAAKTLEQRLMNAQEGTEEYYRAQIELAKLLAAWRYKIGSAAKGQTPEVPGIMGPGRAVAAKWSDYLKANGILSDPRNTRILSKSAIMQQYALTETKKTSNKRTNTKSKTEPTAEEVSSTQLENGRKIIQYFIEIARLGQQLNTIRHIDPTKITAEMFDDEHLEKWIRGRKYTKEDIGSYAPGKTATPSAIQSFLNTMGITEADLAEANTTEETEFLTPLKKYIYAFMQNRKKLNDLLVTLTETQSGKGVVDSYKAAGADKTEYLAGDLTAAIKSLTPKTPQTKAQQYVAGIFKKYNVDLSALPSAKTYAEQWQIIQSQLIGKKGLDFDNLMSDLGQLKGNVGKTYENFMALLKVSRAYMETSNALGDVGQEANLLITGETSKKETVKRRWNNETGQYEEVNRTVSEVVRQGIRGVLKNLKVVFEDELGRAFLGYNLGKGYMPDDAVLGASASYTKIIEEFTEALRTAARIAFGSRMPMLEGSADVAKWNAPTQQSSTRNSQYKFTSATTEKSEIESQIARLQTTHSEVDSELTTLTAQLNATSLSSEDVAKVVQLSTQLADKRSQLQEQATKTASLVQDIEVLKDAIANPKATYEDIVTKLLYEKEELQKLKQELAQQQKNTKPGAYNAEIDKLREQISARQNTIESLTQHANFASRGASDEYIKSLMSPEGDKLVLLEQQLAEQVANEKYKANKQEIARLEQERAPLLERIGVLRQEIQQIKTNAGENVSQEQQNIIQQKEQEVNGLLTKSLEYSAQIAPLQTEVTTVEENVRYLTQAIEAKRQYLASLQGALQNRQKAKTPEELQRELESKIATLNKSQEEEARIQNEMAQMRGELQQFGDTGVTDLIVQLSSRIAGLRERLNGLNKQLAEAKSKLASADDKTVTYSKSYERAQSDLPYVKNALSAAKSDLLTHVNQYTHERTSSVTDALVKKQQGLLTTEEINALQGNLHNIIQLNEQLQSGTITRAEYIKKVTDAYLLMRNASTAEAQATAKADAEKLANATLLVKKYQEEEEILQRIIRTQKPKPTTPSQTNAPGQTQPASSSAGQSSAATTSSTMEPQHTPNSGSVSANAVLNSGNGLVLNLGGSGIATENTVSKIYELLAIRKGDGYTTQIDALKALIAEKEAEKQKPADPPKETKEQKPAQTATPPKNDTKPASTPTPEAKPNDISAEKQKTAETNKQLAAETKKTEESKKQEQAAKSETKETQKQASSTKNKDAGLAPKATTTPKQTNQSMKEYLASQYQNYQEAKNGNSVFREQRFYTSKDAVIQTVNGLIAMVGGSAAPRGFDAKGHRHPDNAPYSSQDLKSIASLHSRVGTYDSDSLITPDYVYRLEGLQKVSSRTILQLAKQFDMLENSGANHTIRDKAKESYLYHFAQENGLTYSKSMYDASGETLDVTQMDNLFSKEAIKLIQEYSRVATSSTRGDYASWQKNKQALMEQMRQNAEISPYLLTRDDEKQQAGAQSRATTRKYTSGTLIQEAIDHDFDLSLFVQEFKEFFAAMTELGETIPADSKLGQLSQRISGLRKFDPRSTEYKNELDEIKTLATSVFGKSAQKQLDPRMVAQLEAIAQRDTSGKIARVIAEQRRAGKLNYTDIDQADTTAIKEEEKAFAAMTLDELKAELARLEGLRDSEQVDPRFATAAKQDVIIQLLKSGVRVIGSGIKVDDTTNTPSSTKKKEEPKLATKGQTVDTARKEVDTATGAASTTVKDSGEVITKTAQKCGAEILNVTKTVKNGIERTTASINNDYETAMKKTNAQVGAYAGRGLFGATYDPNISIETTDAQAALNKYTETYAKLEELIAKFKGLSFDTAEGQAEATKLQTEINATQKDLDYFEEKLIGIAHHTEDFLGGKEAFAVMDTGALDQTGVSLKLLAQQSENAMVAFNGLYNDGTKLLYDVFDPATSSFKRYALEVDKATGYVRRMETAQTGLVNAFQNVNKVRKQSADLSGISGINSDASLVKQYNEARHNLNQMVNDAWTKAKSENRLVSLDEQKEIYALSNEVLRLGKRIISTANSFKTFEAEGGQTFDVIRGRAESLESAMRQLAMDNALDNKMSIGNISYNDATKKLSYDLVDLSGNVRRVTMAYVDLFNQVKITSDNSTSAIDKVSAGIQEDLAVISNAVDSGLIDVRTNEYTEYEKELKEMMAYREQLEAKDDKLTQSEVDNLNMRKQAVKALGEELVAIAKQNASSMGQGSRDVGKEIGQKNTVDVGVRNFGVLANSKVYKDYLSAYQEMINKQEEFKTNGVLAGQSEQEQLSRLAKTTRLAREEFERLAHASAQFDAKIKSPENIKQLPMDFEYSTLEQEMKRFVLSQQGLTQSQKEMIEQTWSFKNAQDGATYSVRQGKDEVASMSVIFDQGTSRIGQYTVETNKYRTGMEKFVDSLKGKWKELLRYLMTFGSFYRVFNMLKQGIQYIRDIDSALTELKKVTDETDETYDRFLNTASKTASKVGSTIKEVVSSTADFARLGSVLAPTNTRPII